MRSYAIRTRRRAMMVLALPLLGACGAGRTVNPFADDPAEGGRGEVTIDVQNLNFNDATVFAVRNGQEIRVGRVTGKTDGRFRIDWTFALPLQVSVDLVGGGRCRTPSLLVDPGDRLAVQIPSAIGVTRCQLVKR